MDKFAEIENYLKELKQKIRIFGILFFDDRGKNHQALLDLEISPKQRETEIMKLNPENYVQGPLDEKMHSLPPMWVFGRVVKGKEIYIKVSKGKENVQAVCISFHMFIFNFQRSYGTSIYVPAVVQSHFGK